MEKYKENSIESLSHSIHEQAKKSGFWDKEEEYYNDPLVMAGQLSLVVSEVCEAIEALRRGNDKSKKIPPFSELGEEVADAIVRLFDFCQYHNIDIAGAIDAKIEYNKSRPKRHGKKF